MMVLRSTPKKEIFPPGTPRSQTKHEVNGSAAATKEYSFQLGDPVWAKIKVIYKGIDNSKSLEDKDLEGCTFGCTLCQRIKNYNEMMK